jgi:uncharacterized protein (DUF2164 family)
MAILLPDETQGELVASLQRYFAEERGEEIGALQAQLLLEFVLKEVGPAIYNQAVRDAQARLHGAVADLDGVLHEPELGYTAERRARRNAR